MNGGVQPPTTRECGLCHEVKGLADFNTWPIPGKGGRTGIRRICRACEPIMNAPVESEQPAVFSPGLAVSLAMASVARSPSSQPGSDELLLLLLRRLPVGQRWTAGERGRWLRAFGGVLDFLVATEAETLAE